MGCQKGPEFENKPVIYNLLLATLKVRETRREKIRSVILLKFVFSKKATKFDKLYTVDLTLTTYCQIDGEDFFNFCGLLRKHKL